MNQLPTLPWGARMFGQEIRNMNASEQVIKAKVLATPEGNPAIAVTEGQKKKGKLIERFVIKDVDLGVFRSAEPLSHRDAWCSGVREAKWYTTRKKAQDALYEMWSERMAPKKEGEA